MDMSHKRPPPKSSRLSEPDSGSTERMPLCRNVYLKGQQHNYHPLSPERIIVEYCSQLGDLPELAAEASIAALKYAIACCCTLACGKPKCIVFLAHDGITFFNHTHSIWTRSKKKIEQLIRSLDRLNK